MIIVPKSALWSHGLIITSYKLPIRCLKYPLQPHKSPYMKPLWFLLKSWRKNLVTAYRGLSERLQYLQCVSTGDAAVFRQTMGIINAIYIRYIAVQHDQILQILSMIMVGCWSDRYRTKHSNLALVDDIWRVFVCSLGTLIAMYRKRID